jgi:uncharacterized BrkB/YihY/UPF0761 family membrane protein
MAFFQHAGIDQVLFYLTFIFLAFLFAGMWLGYYLYYTVLPRRRDSKKHKVNRKDV